MLTETASLGLVHEINCGKKVSGTTVDYGRSIMTQHHDPPFSGPVSGPVSGGVPAAMIDSLVIRLKVLERKGMLSRLMRE